MIVAMPGQVLASIESEVQKVEEKIEKDKQDVLSFTCGGLVHGAEDRFAAYYAKRDPLECELKYWCKSYNKSIGACEGLMCEIVPTPGYGDRFREHTCSGGICTASTPSKACSNNHSKSQYRIYDCNGATAECFTYVPNLYYETSYYPFAYNCVLTYDSSPVHDDEPRGEVSVLPSYNIHKIDRDSVKFWDSTPGSSISTEASGDSSLGPLTLDKASVSISSNTLHRTVDSPFRMDDYPNLERMMSKLLQPPEVRLILPSGGIGLQEESTIFSRIFESQSDPLPGHVLKVLGNEPDALRTAAEYLRSMPLVETRYIPVEVAVPSVSSTEIDVLIKDWEAWLAVNENELSSDVSSRVRENIITLIMYEDIQDSVREYRLHFPSYLSALLSYVEKVNTFFRDHWIEYNAGQLEDWHKAYEQHIPFISQELRNIYTLAAQFTSQCLVPACRMDVVPVNEGVRPWDLFPENTQFPLAGGWRAWTPESLPLWENAHGRVSIRHPFTTLGFPLPDITLDLSEIFIQDPIKIPVLKLEMHEIDIPYPPSVSDVTKLREDDFPSLPRFYFPEINLDFPDLVLPDPKDSLFVVPEVPEAIPVWTTALVWQKQRLSELIGVCASTPTPRTFLAHEFQIFDAPGNPAAVRAVSIAAGLYSSKFGAPSVTWMVQYPDDHAVCSDCTTVRPQRYIRQHMQLNVEWELLQDRLLRAVDKWNAKVRFWSVVPHEESAREMPGYKADSGLPEKLFPLDR